MPWLVLVAAAALEVGWATLLPTTEGFSRLVPSLATLALLAGSMAGLAWAAQAIPIGTAYAVWVGIGAVGTALLGIVVHGEPANPARLGALLVLIGGIVLVKATASAD